MCVRIKKLCKFSKLPVESKSITYQIANSLTNRSSEMHDSNPGKKELNHSIIKVKNSLGHKNLCNMQNTNLKSLVPKLLQGRAGGIKRNLFNKQAIFKISN